MSQRLEDRGFFVRAMLIAQLVCVLSCATFVAAQHAEQAKQPAEHATPLAQFKPLIPYLDPAHIVQEYKMYKGAQAKKVAFKEQHVAAVGVEAVSLLKAELAAKKVVPHAGVPVRIGDKYICTYQLQHQGVPLSKASEAMCIIGMNGHVIAMRERNIPHEIDATKATVEGKAALEHGQKHFTDQFKVAKPKATEPTQEIWVTPEMKGKLCWTFILTNESLTEPVAARLWVTALGDPKVLAVDNLIHHEHFGTVTGTVWETSPLRATVELPLGFLDVTRAGGGSARPTGMDGRFSFLPGNGTTTISGALAGPYAVIQNQAGPGLTRTQTGNDLAPINLRFDASGEAELAQVSAFHATNVVHDFARDFLLPSHLFQMPVRVNINQSCNAFFSRADVSINFFKAGSGCPNTAYSDVVYHEYGHAIDNAFGGIRDGGYSEGFGDSVAMLITRQPCVGRDFFGKDTCLRNYATLSTTWPPSNPEVHFVGQIYGGFTWRLIQELQKQPECEVEKEDAFDVAKRLIMFAAVANPKDIPDAVFLSFLADDDDGDLTNGTPHFAQLAAAADSRKIPRPPNPTVVTTLPMFVYQGGCGTHHLVAKTGTASYCWKREPWLTALKYEYADSNFFYYCETGFSNYRWAFARTSDYCGQFAVWFLPNGESKGEWVFFQRACQRTPINADETQLKLRRP